MTTISGVIKNGEAIQGKEATVLIKLSILPCELGLSDIRVTLLLHVSRVRVDRALGSINLNRFRVLIECAR